MSDTLTDAELVLRIRSGDESAFSLMYRRYADGLRGFVARQVRDWATAEDLVQEVFVLASQRIGQLTDPNRLRSWLYAIAARRTYSFLRSRRFDASVDDDAVQLADAAAGPEDRVTAAERLSVLLAACDGLSVDDRQVVRLFLSGLDGSELAAACGNTPSQAYVKLHRAKKRLALSLGALLVARHGRRGCAGLDALLDAWDGTLTPQLRRDVVRHVERCDRCERLRLRLLRPEALLGVIVLCTLPAAWRGEVVDDLELASSARPDAGGPGGGSHRVPAAAAGAAGTGVGGAGVGGPGAGGGRGGGAAGDGAVGGGRSRAVRAGAAAAALLAAATALGVWSADGGAERPTADDPAPVAGGPGPSAPDTPGAAEAGPPDSAAPAPTTAAVPSRTPGPSGAAGRAAPGVPPAGAAAPPGEAPVPPAAVPAGCTPGGAPVARQVGRTIADDFESGTLAGFHVDGDTRVVARVGPVLPPSCTGRMLLVGTGPGALGLRSGDRPYVQASTLTAPVSVPPGAGSVTARLRWNFLTSEYGRQQDRADGGRFRDRFSVRLIDSSGESVAEFAGGRASSARGYERVELTAADLPEVDGSVGQSGWYTAERTFRTDQVTGAVFLQIVAWDVRDTRRTSAVLVDDLHLSWR